MSRHDPETSSSRISAEKALLTASAWVARNNFCPATGGNFSARIDQQHFLVTRSGAHKEALLKEDLVLLSTQGQNLEPEKTPSYEAGIHTALMALDSTIGTILHTHTLPSTVLSLQEPGTHLNLVGYEMIKSIRGFTSHLDTLSIPLIENNQEIMQISQHLRTRWEETSFPCCFILRGHGSYIWGHTVQEALRHLEGLEFLLRCELSTRQLTSKIVY